MSIYDHVWLGTNVYIVPDFGYESVTLRIFYKKPGCAFEKAWDPDGGHASPTVPLRIWEDIQRASKTRPDPDFSASKLESHETP